MKARAKSPQSGDELIPARCERSLVEMDSVHYSTMNGARCKGLRSRVKRGRFLRGAIIAAVLLSLPALVHHANGGSINYFKGLSEKNPMIVDKRAREIRLLAVLQPDAFKTGWFKQLPGHHAVTWKGGAKAREAFLVTFTSDARFHDALVSIGARPGNNVSQEAWDQRKNKQSKAPETRVEGSPVDVSVWWEGLSKPLPLEELIKDPGGRQVDLRFGGHKHLIPVWKSGCIVCMQSCPGAKISNRNRTLRDYVEGKATFAVQGALVPPGKRKAVVLVRVSTRGTR